MFIGAIKKSKRYQVIDENVYIGATKKNKRIPIVKVRVSRGKTYDPNKKVTKAEDAEKYFREYMTKNKVEGQEQYLVMYLGRGNQVLGIYPHSLGGMTATILEIKMIVDVGVQLLAEAAITAHNHPSGNINPSDQDKITASKLKEAFNYFDIKLLDNLILTKTSSTSY